MPNPDDFITELAAAAAQMHEAYLAYVAAGFTESQTFELVRTILEAGMGKGV